ncbi:hypothetical protein DFJ66_0232 [Saccharothrix variisporea]|uniref:Uncharacterized protein n=1 Tax=Saccharothrix variisporea TaxID=543527 RepID=A0A495X1J0_9PSEU|nr:hypothetical protein DFJ66_0232 [Saccharothrix variisporea]
MLLRRRREPVLQSPREGPRFLSPVRPGRSPTTLGSFPQPAFPVAETGQVWLPPAGRTGERNRRPSHPRGPAQRRASAFSFDLESAPARSSRERGARPARNLEKRKEKAKSASPAGRPPRMDGRTRAGAFPSSPYGLVEPTTDFPGAAKIFCSFLTKNFGCTREICGSPSGRPYGDDGKAQREVCCASSHERPAGAKATPCGRKAGGGGRRAGGRAQSGLAGAGWRARAGGRGLAGAGWRARAGGVGAGLDGRARGGWVQSGRARGG